LFAERLITQIDERYGARTILLCRDQRYPAVGSSQDSSRLIARPNWAPGLRPASFLAPVYRWFADGFDTLDLKV
jgi:hypothetical protein